MMEIRRFESDLLSSNMYLIVEGDHGIVIDPCRDTAPAEGLVIDYILLTHEHYDHISGVPAWKEATRAKVLCSQACGENIQSPRRNLASTFKVFCELQDWVKLDRLPDADPQFSCHADETFEDETVLTWRGHAFRGCTDRASASRRKQDEMEHHRRSTPGKTAGRARRLSRPFRQLYL